VASAASATGGRAVTVSTSAQGPLVGYTVTVAASVTDSHGTPLSSVANDASFTGFSMPAVVRFNEINANIQNSCDLIELRVVSGGTMDGFQLWERNFSIHTFASIVVATNDILVVHIDQTDATCNPVGSLSESSSPTEFPAATHPGNYDTAWDLYSLDTGLTNTDNVLTLYDARGTIVDVVFVAHADSGGSSSATLLQANAVQPMAPWFLTNGDPPAGGIWTSANFRPNAVLDLDGTGTDRSGVTIQRIDDDDTNTTRDWSGAAGLAPTWGTLNAGQTPF
jgi:hypothetical protein